MKKGYENGLSKKQVANIFLHQNTLGKAFHHDKLSMNIMVCGRSVKADFYNDCVMLPDPAELNVDEKNLLVLDECFLGKQNKAEAYYTRERHNNCDTFYIAENYFKFYYPLHSWLLMEGDLVKVADDGRYQGGDLITLTNNAIMYLFTNIKYSLGGMEKV